MSEQAIGAVLAGGASTRMGRPKATLELAGQPLATRALARFESAGLEAIVVAKRSSPLPPVDARVVTEPDEPRHPLTGIVTVLRATRRPIVVLGCDMPLVPASLLVHLAEAIADPDRVAIVAKPGGELEPLLAAYSPAAAQSLASALSDQAPLREAVAALEPSPIGDVDLRRFGDPETIALNVNSPADLDRAATLLSSATRP